MFALINRHRIQMKQVHQKLIHREILPLGFSSLPGGILPSNLSLDVSFQQHPRPAFVEWTLSAAKYHTPVFARTFLSPAD